MSYILDALKKSEQERGHGNIPGVQTVHSSSLNYHGEKKAYWPYLLITAVLLNVAVVLYFIFDKEQSVTNQAEVTPHTNTKNDHKENTMDKIDTSETGITEQTAITTPDINKEAELDELKPSPVLTHTPVNEQAVTASTTESQTRANTIEPKPAATYDNAEIIDFYNLPESIRQQLPTITISAHVYSSNPSQRSIVINNNFMEEGEYVLDNLILIEITSGGAIFNYEGTQFSYPVISSWR